MKRLVFLICFFPFVNMLWAQNGNAYNDEYPPNPVPGKCYAKCQIPDEYKTVTEQILVKEASQKITILPAEFATVYDTIVVKPEYKRLITIPPVYETVTERILVKEVSKRLISIPAIYETVEEQVLSQAAYVKKRTISPVFATVEETILVKEATTKWIKNLKDPNCLSVNPEDCQVLCLVAIPAEYKTILKQIIKTPAKVVEEQVPAVYKTIKKEVLKAPASFREIVIPAEYQIITKNIVKSPATTKEEIIPAEYKIISRTIQTKATQTIETDIPAEYGTVTKTALVRKGGMSEWREVMCDAKVTISYEIPTNIPLKKPMKSKGNPASSPTDNANYEAFVENEFISPKKEPVSTFSLDADAASYSNIYSYIMDREQKPPKDAIRLEEMINYFDYSYPEPKDGSPIFVDGEITSCPWNSKNKLVRIGFKGKGFEKEKRPVSNLVFLIDVSGSMSRQMPLLIQSFKLLVDQLAATDYVSIVTYAGADKLVLSPTSGIAKHKIKTALDNLEAEGSTNGANGIITAYELAQQHFIKDANNRIILVTDGDFNVGISDRSDLIKLIEEKRKTGVFLSVIGMGRGNYNDSGLEALADNGNGVFEYLSRESEAQKIFVEGFDNFFTVAKDVKIQINFNPQLVKTYRLIGYENRKLNQEDFENDAKDAGDLSANQSLTALYEIEPATKYADGSKGSLNMLEIHFRYKERDEAESKLIKIEVADKQIPFEKGSENLRFAAAVAAGGMLLRDSKYKGSATYDKVLEWAGNALGSDKGKHRADFLIMIKKAEQMK